MQCVRQNLKKPALRLFARCQGHGEDVNFSKFESQPQWSKLLRYRDLHPMISIRSKTSISWKQNFDLLESFLLGEILLSCILCTWAIVIHSNPLSMCRGRSLKLGGTFLVKFQVAQWNWSSLLELKRWQIQSDSFYFCNYCGQLDIWVVRVKSTHLHSTHLRYAPVWFVEPKLADVWAAQ